jgi:hypothetical protein
MTKPNIRSGAPAHSDFESLFVNNQAFNNVQAYLNRFNPIRTMKMERMEIRHSSILGWLMKPDETHGLGDSFLKALLAEALRGRVVQGQPTALDVVRADLSGASVRVEWRNIDVFVLCEAQNWAFIIENKFGAKQRKDQLIDYKSKIQSIFGTDVSVSGLFLTLNDELADDESYAPISYETVCTIISDLLSGSSRVLSPEVQTFVIHYLEVLQEATGMSEQRHQMERLAREIYSEHRRVLDFIMEYGVSTDFAIAARALFGDEPDSSFAVPIGARKYRFSWLGSDKIGFLPEVWFDALGQAAFNWKGCENYWLGYPVGMWIQLQTDRAGDGGSLKLCAEVGPIAVHSVREKLIEDISALAKEGRLKITFQKGASSDGKKFSRFFKNNTVTVTDTSNSDQIVDGIRKLLANFDDEIAQVSGVLSGLLNTEIARKA